MAGGNIVHIKGDNWKTEVLNSNMPVLVDFWLNGVVRAG